MIEEENELPQSEESVFDFTTPSVNKIEVESDEPHQLSPEWHDYVMSKFTDTELVEINGERYPNCYGLRRVVELLIGEIVESKPTNLIVSSDSTGTSPGRVTCVYEVAIRSHDSGQIKRYGDVAEVFSLNCDDLFLAYPAATAVTRAEGRCLRKLLKVRCVAAEELTRNKNVGEAVRTAIKSGPTDGSYQDGDPITGAQIRAMQKICSQMKIDVSKFINMGEKTYSRPEDITKKTAINMIKLLNDYQNNSRPVPLEIISGD
jgi:hypothetical protein